MHVFNILLLIFCYFTQFNAQNTCPFMSNVSTFIPNVRIFLPNPDGVVAVFFILPVFDVAVNDN